MNNNMRTHSGFGLASFILSLIAVLTTAIFIIAALKFISVGLTYGGMFMIGLLIIATLLFSLIGLIFGIIAVCQKNRKKLYSILGIVISAVVFVTIVFLFILGHYAVI